MLLLDGASLTRAHLHAIAFDAGPVGLTDEARARVTASRRVVDRVAAGDRPVYGINTGFGSFAEVKIPPDALDTCYSETQLCDCFIIAGTSATVYPAASFPQELLGLPVRGSPAGLSASIGLGVNSGVKNTIDHARHFRSVLV